MIPRKAMTVLAASAVIGIAAYLVATQIQTSQPKLDPDILARSHEYVEKFGTTSLNELSKEDQLLLLHSYFNLKDYQKVVELAEEMLGLIRSLPPQQQTAFLDMIRTSFKKVGKSREGENFYQKVLPSELGQ